MLIAVKIVAIAIAAVLGNYLLNQLSTLRDFPGKTWLLVRLLGYLTVIAIAHEIIGSAASEGIKESTKQYWRYGGVAAGVAIVYEGFTLWQYTRRLPEQASDNLASAELLRRLHSDVRTRVKDRLAYAIGEKSINLSWETQHSKVGGGEQRAELSPARNWLLKLFPIGKGTVDIGENILEAFTHEDVDRKLLILGEPGSGKTTTLLKLAEALIAQFETTEQVPYIFELSAWRDDRLPILDWLMGQLHFDHGIDPKVSRLWIKHNKLLPLLDGLDELRPDRQKNCVDRINEFATLTGQQLVVCCRSEEYTVGELELRMLNGALCLQPLTEGKIERYLRSLGRKDIWQSIRKRPELVVLMKESAVVGTNGKLETPFLQIPLFLQMLVVACRDEIPTSKASLFDAYVAHQLKLETCEQHRQWAKSQRAEPEWAYVTVAEAPDVEQTKRYLAWLAKKLKDNNIPNVFLIEQMQPDWLETKAQKWQYRLIFGLIVGLIFGLMFGLIVGLIVGLIFGLIFGLISGLSKDQNIETVETFKFSFSRTARKRFLKEMKEWLIGGLIVGLIGGLIVGLIVGLIFGLISGLIFGLISGLKEDFKTRDIPNQGIISSARNFLVITLATYLPGVALSIVLTIVRDGSFTWSNSFIEGISYALIFGFLNAGFPVVQHATLRFLLHRQGHVPNNYAKFLQYTTERRLTQQIGGSFRFIHRELLDHFAAMEPDRSEAP